MGPFVGTLLPSAVGGNIANDALGAVPVVKSGDHSPTLIDGTVVQPGGQTPRQHLFTSAAIVVVAAVILLGGARWLRNARIA